ncbi:MAG: hypothetical protein JRD93_21220 [Deltaproteobacteria bacterium]|nr:hypothetical protein [Deltaproteobacteria bacterium]
MNFVADESIDRQIVEDGKTVRAVIRSIEVIGKAASKISIDFRKEHPDVPWQKISC